MRHFDLLDSRKAAFTRILSGIDNDELLRMLRSQQSFMKLYQSCTTTTNPEGLVDVWAFNGDIDWGYFLSSKSFRLSAPLAGGPRSQVDIYSHGLGLLASGGIPDEDSSKARLFNELDLSRVEECDIAYVKVAEMTSSDLLTHLQSSPDIVALFQNCQLVECNNIRQLWVFKGDIDWDKYLGSGTFSLKSPWGSICDRPLMADDGRKSDPQSRSRGVLRAQPVNSYFPE